MVLVTDNDNDGEVMITMKMRIIVMAMMMMMMMLITMMATMTTATTTMMIITGKVKLVAFCPGQPERPKSPVYTLKSKRANIPFSFLWDSPRSSNTSTNEYFIGRYIVSL